jgi:diguanylate cyclase (GGDEF)-like protein/PAS domain S-box-containing protein
MPQTLKERQNLLPELKGNQMIQRSSFIGEPEAEETLTSSLTLEQFFAIVEGSDDAIITRALDGRVTSWNSGAQNIFGYTEQEMLGRSLIALFPPELIEEESYLLGQVLEGKKVAHFETERLHKTGKRISVSVTISPLRDQNGLIIGASKNARDITQKVKLEAAANLANAIFLSTDDAVIGKSLDSIVTSWNPGATKIFGYQADEMIGKSIQKLFPIDRKVEETLILKRIRDGQTVDHFETVRVCKDGRKVDVSVTISPIRDHRGRIIGASKIARDITSQKVAETQLRLTSQVFTSTSEGILITDSNGLIVDANIAFSRITGFSREEVLGRDPQTFRSSRQSPSTFRRIRRALMRYGEWKGEIWSRRKDGGSYSVLLTVSRVCDTGNLVSNYVVLFSDITPLKLQQERLEHSAHFDVLTNLPNRLLLADRLKQAMVNCQRSQQLLAVLYMDIDGFKFINDNYGHSVGDELLIAISGQMRSSLREGDTLARIGGDEFAAVLTNLDTIQECPPLLDRLLAACSQPVELKGCMLNVTTSIGVTFYPSDDVDADQLLRNADNAMYEAKRTGKNRFRIFDAAQDTEFKKTNNQLTRIEQALADHEFVLHYQPKVNMRTGVVVGVEALIRWQRPDCGLLLPGTFLPLIEKHPLSERLGDWVLESALQQMDAWLRTGLNLPVSVNISARQLQDDAFAIKLSQLLAKYPSVMPANVELEILETSDLEDISLVQRIMSACHDIGVNFSLDDFGTGYSSLTYLNRLPVQTMKIDQSFIRDMLVDSGNLSIVKGVIGLANAFNRNVIAEGIETAAHGSKLLDLGCELGQGYVIARPMTAEQIPLWITNWMGLPQQLAD